MRKLTGKELAVLDNLKDEIIYHHNQFESARSSVFSAMQIGLWHKLQCGIRLIKIKAMIGFGNWTLWIESNLPFTERTAQLYMKIVNDNPELLSKAKEFSGNKPDLQILTKLREDTIRKHAISFVPDKHQPIHELPPGVTGNPKFPKLVHFGNIANEYSRLKQRHMDGLQEIDFDQTRWLCQELYQFLQWLYGDSKTNPWRPPS